MIPEGLREIPSLPGVHISETGQVWVEPWRGSDGRLLPGGWRLPYVRRDKYNLVTLYSKSYLLHRLVAETYIPNPEGHPVVRHLDDNPDNNQVSNLAWGSHADNTQDMISRGRAGFQRLTHCVKGHDIQERDAGGNCKGCTADRRRSGLPREDPRHGTANGFNNYGCRCGPCTEAESQRGKRKYLRKVGANE